MIGKIGGRGFLRVAQDLGSPPPVVGARLPFRAGTVPDEPIARVRERRAKFRIVSLRSLDSRAKLHRVRRVCVKDSVTGWKAACQPVKLAFR